MAFPAYTTLYYNQTLDHTQPFHPSNPTWPHRYLLNDDSWGKPSVESITSDTCPGPLLLYTGNEGPIDAFWSGNGFMMEMADMWGGLILFPEERFYGESIPSADYSFMSTQQVLFTGWALAHCMYTYPPTGKRQRVRDNYSSVGKACYGPNGERAVKYVQMANLTSVGIVYLVLVASTMSPLVDLTNHLTFLNHLSNANQR